LEPQLGQSLRFDEAPIGMKAAKSGKGPRISSAPNPVSGDAASAKSGMPAVRA